MEDHSPGFLDVQLDNMMYPGILARVPTHQHKSRFRGHLTRILLYERCSQPECTIYRAPCQSFDATHLSTSEVCVRAGYYVPARTTQSDNGLWGTSAPLQNMLPRPAHRVLSRNRRPMFGVSSYTVHSERTEILTLWPLVRLVIA